MQRSFIILASVMLSLSSCSQNNSRQKATSQKDQKEMKVGGPCEGCEAIYETPVPFEKLNSTDTLPDFNEAGQKIEISGIVYQRDGKTPAKDVIIYVYHTDQTGLYTAKAGATGWGKRHGYIRGWMKTDQNGFYQFYTLRPAAYPGHHNPQHIHITIREPGKSEHWIDEYLFDDDPILTATERNKTENRGGNGIIKLIPRANGIAHGTRHIILGLNVPDYPYSADNIIRTVIPGYKWTEHTGNAAFPKSYNFQLFTIRDTIWAFHSAGNWYSVNGKDWTKSVLSNSINNLGFLDYVFFNNAVYGLGHFEGNIEKYKLTTEVYKTTDLKSWTILSTESNLPKRFFYHPFVFQNKIWIIGGSDDTQQFGDIWNSDDGIHWTKRADNLPFGKRDGSQFIFFNNKIYLLNNDVWSSPDGITWMLQTNEIVKDQAIFGYAPVVFDNKIWLLGCNRNNVFKSELLVSRDGKTWTAQKAPWSPRGGIAACIFKGKIFMTGGKYGGPGITGQTEFVYSNDVWSLEKDR